MGLREAEMTATYSMFGGIAEALGKVLKHPATSTAAIAATPVVAGGAASGMAGLVSRMRDTREKAQSYQEMMKLHPQLQRADQERVKRYFGTLSRFNPMMAKDPTVSGAWVTNIIDAETELDAMAGGQALLKGVQDLAGIRSHLSGAVDRERSRGSSFGKTVQDMGDKMVSAGLSHEKAKWEERLQEQQLKNQALLAEAKARSSSPDTFEDYLASSKARAESLREEIARRQGGYGG